MKPMLVTRFLYTSSFLVSKAIDDLGNSGDPSVGSMTIVFMVDGF